MLKTLNDAQGGAQPGRFYMARVVENKDPEMRQRVKVNIPNVMMGAAPSLPWIIPITYPAHGGTQKTHMVVSVPHIGDDILVLFQDGDLAYGMYVGSYPIAGQDIGPLAENYPNRYGFRDPAGNHLYVDTTEGKTDIEFRHNSGTKLHIDNTGNVQVHVVATRDTLIDIDDNLHVKGNSTTRVEGNRDEVVLGDESFHTEGNFKRAVNGTEDSTVHGRTRHQYDGDFITETFGNIHEDKRRNETTNIIGQKREVVSDSVTLGWNNSATVTVTGVYTLNVNGNANINVTGWITSRATQWIHTGPVEINGNLVVRGNTHTTGTAVVNSNLSVYGDGMFAASISVFNQVRGHHGIFSDAWASSISLRVHKHWNGNNGWPTGFPF